MEDPLHAMIIDLVEKTARIEAKQEAHGETLSKIEIALTPMLHQVHSLDTKVKGFSWLIGIIISFFTAKFLGKF